MHRNTENTCVVRDFQKRLYVVHVVNIRIVVGELRAGLNLLARCHHSGRRQREAEHLREFRSNWKYLERLSRGRTVDYGKIERVGLERLEIVEI